MSNFGIKVSSNGVDISKATVSETLLSSQSPLMKLDSTVKTSFQNIVIFFSKEIPNPGASQSSDTLIYRFKHTYTYTPSIWAMCQAVGVTIRGTVQTTYFTDTGLIGGNNTAINSSFVTISTGADDTYCYIYAHKFTKSTGVEAPVIGVFLNLRFYAFVNDLSGNDVPTHA
jgi:hypothetical protein